MTHQRRTGETGRGKPGMRTADRVYEELRREILAGEIKQGERITEELLAERFGASRTPVRSALVKLAADGFIQLTPRSGSIVKSRSRSEIADIYAVRALLESAAAGRAAQARNEVDLQELTRLQSAMREWFQDGGAEDTGRIEKLSVLNKAFHQRILDASGNATLADSASRLMDISFLINTYTKLTHKEIARSLDEHDKLIAAIASGDADWAKAIMSAHILGACNSLAATASGGSRGQHQSD